MFWKRFISGFFVLLITLVFGYLGGPALAVLLAVLSSVGYIEFTKATKVREPGHRMNVLEWTGLFVTVFYYLFLIAFEIISDFPQDVEQWLFRSNGFFTNYSIIMLLLLMVGFAIILCSYIFAYPKFNNNQVANGVFGIVYVAFMMSFVYYTRSLENGLYYVWFIFITSWVADTCAYFVGSLIGKHKMTPNLSPKKSWEGAVGGVLGSSIASALYGFYVCFRLSMPKIYIVSFACIGAVGAVISICGDLVASAFKRNNDVKDYGKIIPGHGGVLDRFDSVLFTAPMVYFLIVLVMNINF